MEPVVRAPEVAQVTRSPFDAEGVLLLVATAGAVCALAEVAGVGFFRIEVAQTAAEATATLLAATLIVCREQAAAVRAVCCTVLLLGPVHGNHVAKARVHAALLARLGVVFDELRHALLTTAILAVFAVIAVVLVVAFLFEIARKETTILGVDLALECGHGGQANAGIVDLLPLTFHEPFELVVETDVAALDLGVTQRVSAEDFAGRILLAEHLGIGALPDDLLAVIGIIAEPNRGRLDYSVTGCSHGRQGTSLRCR
jgi:hypothetical protein